MSWLFSRALVAEYSAVTCSDGEPSAQLSLMPSPRPFLRSDKTTDFCPPSQFGLTLQPLTATRGEALLTWYRADFRAKTSVLPAAAKASTEHRADSGRFGRAHV